jgi:hypothetical protein
MADGKNQAGATMTSASAIVTYSSQLQVSDYFRNATTSEVDSKRFVTF